MSIVDRVGDQWIERPGSSPPPVELTFVPMVAGEMVSFGHVPSAHPVFWPAPRPRPAVRYQGPRFLQRSEAQPARRVRPELVDLVQRQPPQTSAENRNTRAAFEAFMAGTDWTCSSCHWPVQPATLTVRESGDGFRLFCSEACAA